MLPMLLMMLDETEVTDDGEVVSIKVIRRIYFGLFFLGRDGYEIRDRYVDCLEFGDGSKSK